VVQGFEAPRRLVGRFDARTRIRTSRWSRYVSLALYVAFVVLALPLVPLLNWHYADNSQIRHRERARFFLGALAPGFVLLFGVPAG